MAWASSVSYATLRCGWRSAKRCTASFFGLILNTTAYLIEILRGAIREVPAGVVEAGETMGMNRIQTLLLVVLPIAVRRSLPVLSNEMVFVLHATAAACAITIVDILGAGRALNGSDYVAYEWFITAAVLYILITYSISWIFRLLERRYHTITPALATRGGELWLSFRVMGGFQQPQGHLQVVSNLVDFGMNPQQALDALRFRIDVTAGGEVGLEAGVAPDVAKALEDRGHRVRIVDGYERSFFGGGQIIARNPGSGALVAGSEPRCDGSAAGW